jgi:hypothetical protein
LDLLEAIVNYGVGFDQLTHLLKNEQALHMQKLAISTIPYKDIPYHTMLYAWSHTIIGGGEGQLKEEWEIWSPLTGDEYIAYLLSDPAMELEVGDRGFQIGR